MFNSLKTLIITLLFCLRLFSLNFAQESLTITTYYPSPYGSYDELGTNKLAVDINGVAVPTEYAAMNDGDAHIGRALIVGAGGGSGFAYDEGAITTDGTVLIKGNVGIGTTNPGQRLEVVTQTTSGIRINTGVPGYFTDHTYRGSTFNFGPAEVTDNVSFNISGGGVWTTGGGFNFQQGGTTRLRIDKDGNLLIGATSFPGEVSRLYVVGPVGADGFRAYESQGAYAFMERGTDDDWIVRFGGANVSFGTFVATQIDGAPLLLQTRPDPGNRNVGIGTTNPQSMLEVANTGYFQFSRTSAGDPNVIAPADCNSDAERGRMVIDTTNNRLYICNGAARGWDYIVLTDF